MSDESADRDAAERLECVLREFEARGGPWIDYAMAVREAFIVRLDRIRRDVAQMLQARAVIDAATGRCVIDAETREEVLAIIDHACQDAARLLHDLESNAAGASARPIH
jgi:hypothetical protein